MKDANKCNNWKDYFYIVNGYYYFLNTKLLKVKKTEFNQKIYIWKILLETSKPAVAISENNNSFGNKKNFIIYTDNDLPIFLCEYNITINGEYFDYCFFDLKNDIVIDYLNFPYKTDKDMNYLYAINFAINQLTNNAIDLSKYRMNYIKMLKEIYNQQCLEVIDSYKKYEEYSYSHNCQEVFEILKNDDLKRMKELFPDYNKMINGVPILSSAIDANAKQIFDYYKNLVDVNVDDMRFCINAFHHAIDVNLNMNDKMYYINELFEKTDDINNPDINGETCICEAIRSRQSQLFDFLFEEEKTNINVDIQRSMKGNHNVINLLYCAVESRNSYALKKLIKRIDINTHKKGSMDLLTYTLMVIKEDASDDTIEIIKTLIDNKISFEITNSYSELYEKYNTNQVIINMIEEARNDK